MVDWDKIRPALKVLEWITLFLALGIMLYVIFVAQPRDQQLLKECNVKILCQRGMLTGSICAPYVDPDFNPLNWTIDIEDVPKIGEN